MRLMMEGKRSDEIALLLGIGVGTVNTHKLHAFTKLQANNAAHAAALYIMREREKDE